LEGNNRQGCRTLLSDSFFLEKINNFPRPTKKKETTMKKNKTVSLCLLFLVVLGSSKAFAIDLYGFGSYWNQNDIDGTWGAGIGLSLPIITERLRLDGRVYLFENSDIGDDGDLSITPFDFGLQVHILPSATVDPYILGGISYIYVDSDRFEVDSTVSGYVGLGLDVNLGIPLVKLFGEAIYRAAELDRKFGEDIDAGGFTGNVGFKLHF
jgi:hypothetical protein